MITDAKYEQPGGPQRVVAEAMALANLKELPEAGMVLHDAVVHTALALCQRKTIPAEMESLLSILLHYGFLEGIGRSVSTVKRGDTSITYAPGGLDLWCKLLAPWIRLGTV
jgi:hypothetical protein